MKNRAKCKKCESIIESFHSGDYVNCNCGYISVSGGDGMYCSASDWSFFVRVDDNGNEIIPKIKEAKEEVAHGEPTKEEKLDMLSEMIKGYERLPQHAMTLPITHYDLLSALMLINSILRS